MAATDFERFSEIILGEFKRVHERFDTIDDRFDAAHIRFDHIDRRLDDMNERFDNLESELRVIRERLDTLEDAARNSTGFAKEIDYLAGRLTHIEKHLGLERSIEA